MAPKPKAKAKAAGAKAKAKAKAKVAVASPKKRASSAGAAGPPAKAAKKAKSGNRPADRFIPGRDAYSVCEDYTAKLNQTNIGGNNNKFYVIQVLQKGGTFFAWNRWGRLGEDGQNKLEPHASVESAIKAFTSKFRDKTQNDWYARDSFVAKPGKYTLVEMQEEDDDGAGGSAPLGKLSKAQIDKGMGVLEQIEKKILRRASRTDLEQLSSAFFSLIPTDFGRRVPQPILTEDQLREKEELLKFWLRMGFEDVKEDTSLTPISGIMDLPVPKTLQAAAGAVCTSGAIRSSTSQGERLARTQAGHPIQAMKPPMYGAIMLYTSNAIYQQLNKALREKQRGGITKYFSYLRLLFEAMDSLPKKKSKLWRGIPMDLYDQYRVGSTQTWWNISSCTSDISVARNFMSGCGGKCTLITVEAKTACDISDITFYANEKESLLAPGTQLKVKSSSRKGNVTEISVVEVGRVVG